MIGGLSFLRRSFRVVILETLRMNTYVHVLDAHCCYALSAGIELPRENEYCPRLVRMPSCHKIALWNYVGTGFAPAWKRYCLGQSGVDVESGLKEGEGLRVLPHLLPMCITCNFEHIT